LKRSFLFTIVAGALAGLLAPTTRAQVSSTPENPPPAAASPLRYEVTAGYGYSTINQLNQSRYGLQGIEASAARYWGKHFAVVVLGDQYKWATSPGNPGKPSILSILAGPQFRMNIFGPVDGFFRGTMGTEHTGGENETPDYSFAGGIGGGIDISVNRHFAVRISGDRIGASFSVANSVGNNLPPTGNSPHLTWNTRASVGVIYRF
jgi:hypothetical protein